VSIGGPKSLFGSGKLNILDPEVVESIGKKGDCIKWYQSLKKVMSDSIRWKLEPWILVL
jgi:hypothetical protein